MVISNALAYRSYTHVSGHLHVCVARQHRVCTLSWFPPQWKHVGSYGPPPYLTTNTSRRVNYSIQQTSCFWQSGPGSGYLLLLGLRLSLSLTHWIAQGGTSQKEECEPNFRFPIFDCSLNKWVKGRWGVGSVAPRFVFLFNACILQQRHENTNLTSWKTWS